MDLENFVQRLLYMRAECADMLLDQNVIQGDINNYNRIFKKFQSDARDSDALKIKFTGTTII
jgi:hypothetical protein